MRCCVMVFLAVLFAVPARAQFFGGVATEWTQILNKLQLAAIHAQQVEAYADMVKNSKRLPNLPWGRIDSAIDRFQKSLEWTSKVAITMANADARFRKIYPGYARLSSPYHQSYKDWSDTAMGVLASVLRAGQRQHADMMGEVRIIDQLRSKANGSQGRLEALQAQAALAAEVPGQIQQLRQLMLADINAKTIYYGMQLQDKAVEAAAAEHYFTFIPQQETGHKGHALQ